MSIPFLILGIVLIIVGALISMVYATAFGGELLGFVDTFINQIALLFGVIVECIIFAWVPDNISAIKPESDTKIIGRLHRRIDC